MSDKTKQNNTEHLIERLKLEKPKVHNWFIDRKIDLTQLHKYASNITAALAFATTLQQQPEVPKQVKAQTEEAIPETKPKTDKATLVWQQYGKYIHKTAINYDLDPNLIFATIMIESGGNTNAIRHEPRINDASYGLGQILYGTARGLGFKGTPAELYNPEVNIDLIGKYHRRNMDKYGNLSPQELTTAYNTGSPYKTPYPGHINKFNKWYNRTANIDMDLT